MTPHLLPLPPVFVLLVDGCFCFVLFCNSAETGGSGSSLNLRLSLTLTARTMTVPMRPRKCRGIGEGGVATGHIYRAPEYCHVVSAVCYVR